MRILSLCDFTGIMLKPWAEAGHECVAVDIDQPDPGERDGIEYVRADLLEPGSWGLHWDLVFAFPPCTHLSGSGARWWAEKGLRPYIESLQLVAACLDICRTAPAWMLENPVGRLSQTLGEPSFTFDPCDYGGYLDPPGDFYTKRTCIWASDTFNVPAKRPTHPSEGSKMHLMAPSDERHRLRSVTPEGFARAVYEANR